MALVMGIDPGSVSGAWAVLNTEDTELVMAGDVPSLERQISPQMFVSIVKRWNPDLVVIEKVGPMPKQGLSSTFNFGVGYGILQGVFGSHGFSMEYVAPGAWKKKVGLIGTDKDASRLLCLRRWPDKGAGLFSRKKDGNRADATLIAEYGVHVWNSRRQGPS